MTLASRVLAARLGAVHGSLRVVVRDDASEASVHDLRVATRRAEAAIDGLKPILPARRAAWFRKRLARLRRAAGKLRDLDCILRDLQAEQEGRRLRRTDADIARAIEVVVGKRTTSRAALIRALDRFPGRKDWQTHVRKLVAGCTLAGADPRFGRFAGPRLGAIVGRFLEAAAAGHDDTEALHELRIRAKRARYATEILAPPSPVRRRCLASFERFQDLAGRCIDEATAASRFARWARRAEARADRRTFAILATAAAEAAESARKKAIEWLSPARLGRLQRDFDGLRP